MCTLKTFVLNSTGLWAMALLRFAWACCLLIIAILVKKITFEILQHRNFASHTISIFLLPKILNSDTYRRTATITLSLWLMNMSMSKLFSGDFNSLISWVESINFGPLRPPGTALSSRGMCPGGPRAAMPIEKAEHLYTWEQLFFQCISCAWTFKICKYESACYSLSLCLQTPVADASPYPPVPPLYVPTAVDSNQSAW